ncbi:DUF1501 domain-containing protein [Spirosoma utsteinense]|uniref:DUF1501 domain-containing protein n=1 Tax=Spirosoma utsteinense TaxID=2585773 RepID=A0ABR6WE10_9BACT|nr:DUF1501 domain-containing protein [Spirosoma utsteinense]MBC3788884.1 putative protein (DUF1501 family) [Spirosoma utsteinense]MBC3794791.1 putative protein (DUF1501 family) [Spirosoma utsteinense]
MKRRDFLAAASSCLLPLTINGFGIQSPALWQSMSISGTPVAYGDRVLVLIYLNGGNDGLNTVIPLNQLAAYNDLRANIAIPENRILRLIDNTTMGLHPAMTGLRDLSNDGKLSIVHSVGYANPSQSHARSATIWMTGSDTTQPTPTGWVGRYLDNRFPGYPTNYPSAQIKSPLAIQIGSLTSMALLGNRQSMGMAISDPNTFQQLVGSAPTQPPGDAHCCDAGELISFVRQQQGLAPSYASEIKRAADAGRNLAAYPPSTEQNELAEQLKVVARLIHGGLQTKIYFVSMGGFDSHAGQVDSSDTTKGHHADLLGKLSAAITSFQQDLKQQGTEDKVVGMTFSEFGRRANSNASRGTDHGMAAPVFVFGSSVHHRTIGAVPNLSALSGNAANRDVPMQVDFRQIYADVLNDWFGTDRTLTNTLLYREFPTISLFSEIVETVASGSWTNPATWSVGRLPVASDYVTINTGHTITVSQTVTVKNVKLQGKIQFTGSYSIKLTS